MTKSNIAGESLANLRVRFCHGRLTNSLLLELSSVTTGYQRQSDGKDRPVAWQESRWFEEILVEFTFAIVYAKVAGHATSCQDAHRFRQQILTLH